MSVIGRICCDSNGKLNSQSVILQGSQKFSSGHQINLGLSELRQFGLFPGQIVAVEGVNSTGQKLVVNKFCTGVQLPFHSPVENAEHASEGIKSGNHYKISQAAGSHWTVCRWSTLLMFLLLCFPFCCCYCCLNASA